MASRISFHSLVYIFLAITVRIDAVTLPSCQGLAPNQTLLDEVSSTFLNLSTYPFGVGYNGYGSAAFVALNDSLGILNTTAITPTVVHSIPLHAVGAEGLAVSHDYKYVFVTTQDGLVIVDAARALSGDASAAIEILRGPSGTSAIEVTVTKNLTHAIVSQEYGNGTESKPYPGVLQVFKLNSLSGNLTGSYVGNLTLDYAVVGTAISRDGTTMYATSESSLNNSTIGTLSVIDMDKLKTNPSIALVGQVPAGCGPVRVVLSPDGKTVWVTARESNSLLAFNESLLRNNSSQALISVIQVGTKPVGLTFIKNGTRILTADSDRSFTPGAVSGISVVNVTAALTGTGQAVFGRIATGLFPRELVKGPKGKRVLISDYFSREVQVIDVLTLP